MKIGGVSPGRMVFILLISAACVYLLFLLGGDAFSILESAAVTGLVIFVSVIGMRIRRRVRSAGPPMIDLLPRSRPDVTVSSVIDWVFRPNRGREVRSLSLREPEELPALHGLVRAAVSREDAYAERLRPLLETLMHDRARRAGRSDDALTVLSELLPGRRRKQRTAELARIIKKIEEL